MLKKYKVYVKDAATSRKVQDHAFKLGYGWQGIGPAASELEASFLYFRDGRILKEDYFSYFKECLFIELTPEEFCNRPIRPRLREFTIKPFDRVLGRDFPGDEWKCDMFSHVSYGDEDMRFPFHCVGGEYKTIAQYEGNEEYIGTTEDIEDSWSPENVKR